MNIYRTKGTCSREIIFTVDENDVIKSVKFVNGCSGNTQGIARLVAGRPSMSNFFADGFSAKRHQLSRPACSSLEGI